MTIYDGFFNDFPIGFAPSKKFYFNTNGVKDLMPSFWEKTDTGYRATVKTLGVVSAKVEMVNDGIKVSGENEIYGHKYNTSVELPIAEDILNNITEVKYESVAGLTFVEITIDRPEKKKIKITKI